MSAQPLLRRGYGGAQRFAAPAAGLRKASGFGDTAFLREKAVRKRARGRHPLTPELRRSNYRSAAVCKCTGAAQPRLLPLSIWSAPMSSAQPLLRRGYGDVLFRRFWVNLHGYIKFALRRQRLAGRLLIPLTGCRIRGIHFLSAPRNTIPIRVQFENELLDTMIDRFGKSGAQYAPVDDEHFEITAQVRVSDMFFSWVCGFGKRAKIVYPEHIIDEFAAFLDGIKSVY